jgi:hypothetical protein
VAFAADAVRGVGAAQRHALIDGYIVSDLGGFADDDAKAMIDEQVAADRGAGMDVDAGQPARQMIDEAREEEQVRLEQPVGNAVHADGEQPRIEQNFPARTRRGIARLDRVQIGDEPVKHRNFPCDPISFAPR